MAKTKRTIGTTKTEKETPAFNFDIDKIIPVKYQTLVSLGILFILFLIFFAPMYFGGKTFQSGDIVTSKSMGPYVQNHKDGFTLWNPYIFCGMPAYALAVGYKWFNLIYVLITALKSGFASFFSVGYATWTFYLILLSFTSFFLIKYKTQNTLISLFGAIATSFSTGLIVFLFIGHVTKLTAICMYPLIFLILLKFQKKIKLLDVAILIVALQLLVQGWHVQIIFYTLFAIGIYFLYFLIRFLVRKEKTQTTQILKSGGIFAVAAIIAILIQSDNLTQIYQYSPFSTRGTKSVVDAKASSQEPTGTAFYEYATQYSFSPGEVMTFIVPSFYGFGFSNYNGPLTNNQDYRLNTYFGQIEFVDVAMYMGVLIFFLALFAVFTQWKDPYVQFLTILSGLSLLISFGKTFSPVYDLMFNYFPFFDKFRVPSMILVLVQLSLPVLAAIGINKIVSLRKEKDVRAEKIIKFAAIGFASLFVLSIVLSSSLKEWFSTRMIAAGKGQQQIDFFKQISEYASSMFISDVMTAFALTALTFGLAYAYINSKLGKDLMVLGIIVFTVFDLWRIDNRGAEYIQDNNIQDVFRQPDYISAIKAQKDSEPHRLLNLKQEGLGTIGSNSNYNMYFLEQDLYGYSGIKPRAYMDYIDVIGSPANPTLWRMLNVKYLVFDKPINYPGLSQISSTANTTVYKNENALPRAYFVNKVETKPAVQILNAVKNNEFDPQQVAYMEDGSVKADKPDSTASVKIVNYQDEKISIEANASGNNLLFLGDTYFPNGWKATIDGTETQILKVNHAFRGIIVPKGTHKIEFEYAPKSFYISRIVAFSLSSLVILGLIIGLFFEYKNKKAAAGK
ncbi:MAG: YfhO family protein [Methanococcaceae archaeon]